MLEAVRRLIAEALVRWDDPDPSAIGARILARLDENQRDEVAEWGIKELVREHIRGLRPQGDEPNPPTRKGMSRWQTALAERVSVDGTWKMLSGCGYEDLLVVAQDCHNRGEALFRAEERYLNLAAQLRENGCETVRELWDKVGFDPVILPASA